MSKAKTETSYSDNLSATNKLAYQSLDARHHHHHHHRTFACTCSKTSWRLCKSSSLTRSGHGETIASLKWRDRTARPAKIEGEHGASPCQIRRGTRKRVSGAQAGTCAGAAQRVVQLCSKTPLTRTNVLFETASLQLAEEPPRERQACSVAIIEIGE